MKPKEFAIVVIVVVALLGAGGAYYSSTRDAQTVNKRAPANQTQQTQTQQQLSVEDQKVLAQLKKIILLPDNVTPAMAVINNIEIAKKNQPVFFTNAKNGNVLIIYSGSTIIYDPDANKIINIGPVPISITQQQKPANLAGAAINKSL